MVQGSHEVSLAAKEFPSFSGPPCPEASRWSDAELRQSPGKVAVGPVAAVMAYSAKICHVVENIGELRTLKILSNLF